MTAEKMPTISVSARASSRGQRDQVVLDNLSLVKAIAIRVHENLPVHVDLDDLIHSGVLGLFDAVDKFDPEKNVVFHSYAKHRIKGAILDSLRQMDWASRDLRKRQKQADAITRDLTATLGRTPSDQEVAEKLGMEVERWRRVQMELRTVGLVSTTPQSPDEYDRAQDFPSAPDSQPDRICERRQLQGTLARAMVSLPERYQKVVVLYYNNQMTMKEIGEEMGVNESRISQIHKAALKKMHAALQSEGIHSPAAL
jgi:RNA polymerase sigma factor for flagellar operon FliA